MISKSTTWITAWRVSNDGQAVTEYRVSVTDHSATVRTPRQTRGGERITRFIYNHYFATTRAEALAKFIERQVVVFGKMRTEMEEAQLRLTRAMALRDQLAEGVH